MSSDHGTWMSAHAHSGARLTATSPPTKWETPATALLAWHSPRDSRGGATSLERAVHRHDADPGAPAFRRGSAGGLSPQLRFFRAVHRAAVQRRPVEPDVFDRRRGKTPRAPGQARSGGEAPP